MAKWRKIGIAISASSLISSCVCVPEGCQEQVSNIIQERIGEDVEWGLEDPRVTEHIHNLISNPITIESAIQVALLNNPQIQELLEDVQIAQADLVEAGLLTNPAFEIEVRYPHKKHLNTNIEYLITAAFLDIFLIPLRTKLASTELEQAKLRVADKILSLVFDVRKTYYDLLAEWQKLTNTESLAELASIQAEIASRQHQAGNIYQLDLEQITAKSLKYELEIEKSQNELIRLRERLNRLLGLRQGQCLEIFEQLPEATDCHGFDLAILESTALQNRIELEVARYEISRICSMLGLKEGWTYTNLNAGLAGERELEGENILGFGLSGQIPLFNYGQAARLRLLAQLRQAKDHLESLEIKVLSEVREAHKLLMNGLRILNKYQTALLPLEDKILDYSEALYNVMGLGINTLLEKKQQQIEISRDYLESLKAYWISRVSLDYALGGYLFRLLPQEGETE